MPLEEFGRQTPWSFVNAMEGAALRHRRETDLAIYTAWHTARFGLNGYADKGRLAGSKTLAELLGGSHESEPEKLKNAKLIAGFHSLRARGFDVQITRH